MRSPKVFPEVRLVLRDRVTKPSVCFGKMHVLPNYWRIKYEKRCVEVRGRDSPGSEEISQEEGIQEEG